MEATIDNYRRILAIADEDDFADELGITINGSRWGKIAESVGTAHVRRLLSGAVEQWAEAQAENARLLKALALWPKLARPWIDGSVTFASWDEAIEQIDAALSGGAHE